MPPGLGFPDLQRVNLGVTMSAATAVRCLPRSSGPRLFWIVQSEGGYLCQGAEDEGCRQSCGILWCLLMFASGLLSFLKMPNSTF